jgi:predicted kinase
MKKVLIMRGIPGSGKSTFAAKRVEEAQAQGVRTEVCSADDYFLDSEGHYRFDANQLPAAHARSFKLFMLAVTLPPDGDLLVVVDNTNTRAWELAPYIQLARTCGFDVEIVRFHADPSFVGPRNVHGCPQVAIDRMAKGMEKLPPALGQETIVPIRIDPLACLTAVGL